MVFLFLSLSQLSPVYLSILFLFLFILLAIVAVYVIRIFMSVILLHLSPLIARIVYAFILFSIRPTLLLVYMSIRITPIIPTHTSTTISLIPRPQAVCITYSMDVRVFMGPGKPVYQVQLQDQLWIDASSLSPRKEGAVLSLSVCPSPYSRAIRIYDQSMGSCTGVCLTVSTVLFKAC